MFQPILLFKGFLALTAHRVAHSLWLERRESSVFTALLLQSSVSAAFGVDIHPGAAIGCGVMLDHASAVVIGETAVVGDDVCDCHRAPTSHSAFARHAPRNASEPVHWSCPPCTIFEPLILTCNNTFSLTLLCTPLAYAQVYMLHGVTLGSSGNQRRPRSATRPSAAAAALERVPRSWVTLEWAMEPPSAALQS